MIKLTERFDQYAYSVAIKPSDNLLSVGFEEGQWVAPGANGYDFPTAGAKAFMLISSKRTGRDQFSGKASAPDTSAPAQVYVGSFALATDQFDTNETYAPGDALYVKADGKLTNNGSGVVVAYATGIVQGNKFLPIVSA